MEKTLRWASVIALLATTMAWSQERIADVLTDPALDISRPADGARAVGRIRAIENANLECARVKARAKGVPMRRVLPNGTVTGILGLDENGEFLIQTSNSTNGYENIPRVGHTKNHIIIGAGNDAITSGQRAFAPKIDC